MSSLDNQEVDKNEKAAAGQQAAPEPKEGFLRKVAPAAFLAPAVIAGVAIAAAVGEYAPLVYEAPAAVEPVQSANAVELATVDTSDAEKESATGLATETDFGIDLSNVKDGTYTGSGTGFSGVITVQVTIQGGKITAIEIVSSGDDESYFGQVRGLVDTVIEQQSLSIDTVSGATYSSRGLLSAIKNALLQATGQATEALTDPVGVGSTNKTLATVADSVAAPNGYADGVFTGEGEGFNDTIRVSVTIQGGKIAAIDLLEQSDTADYFFRAWPSIPNAMVASQSSKVDAVSGATYSSNGIISAVQSALRKAAAAGNSTKDPTDAVDPDPTPDPDPDNPDGDKSEAKYEDGSYTGYALCEDADDESFDRYYVAVTVVVKDGKVFEIKDVHGTNQAATLAEILDPFNEDNKVYLDYAANGRTVKKVWYEGVVAQLLAGKKSAAIDVVSRSTFSSRSIAAAYSNALELSAQAYKKAHPESADGSAGGSGSGSTGDAGSDSESGSAGDSGTGSGTGTGTDADAGKKGDAAGSGEGASSGDGEPAAGGEGNTPSNVTAGTAAAPASDGSEVTHA
ncbi:MAG: FMN-binding protein [Coriobacteriia bacterium]|nr:FMN-binding protein [Coriobacteriia bacterium]